MNNIYLTPSMLWKGYDPNELPLDETVVKEREKDGIIQKTLYFTSVKAEDGVVRSFAKFVYYKDEPRQTILILRDINNPVDTDAYSFYLNSGYNIFCLDYAGNFSEGRFTLFPESLSYGKEKNGLYFAADGADKSAWFLWAKAAMRGVTYLLSCGHTSEIMLHGEKEGAALAWILAGVDGRVSRCAVLFEAGYNAEVQKAEKLAEKGDKMKEDACVLYEAALSPPSYAQSVKCPLLFITASNEPCELERVFESVKRIPEGIPAHMSIAPRLRSQLTIKNLSTLIAFSKKTELPQRPTLEVSASEGKMYFNIKTGSCAHKVKLYYAGEGTPEYRHWEMIKAQSCDEGEYIACAPLASISETVYAFANVEYEDGVLLSTAVLARKPDEIGIKNVPPVSAAKLLYDNSMDEDCFIADCKGLLNEGVIMERGPFNIMGVRTVRGNLATYKINSPKYRGEDTDKLLVSFFAANTFKLTVAAVEKTEGGERLFRAIKDVSGAQFWQKTAFTRSDFKTAEGALLPGWKNVIKLVFCGETLYNNILWV